MVNDERDAQVARLERVAEQIARLRDRVSGDGSVGVVDTHVLLHYRLFDEIDWQSVLGLLSSSHAAAQLTVRPVHYSTESGHDGYGR